MRVPGREYWLGGRKGRRGGGREGGREGRRWGDAIGGKTEGGREGERKAGGRYNEEGRRERRGKLCACISKPSPAWRSWLCLLRGCSVATPHLSGSRFLYPVWPAHPPPTPPTSARPPLHSLVTIPTGIVPPVTPYHPLSAASAACTNRFSLL